MPVVYHFILINARQASEGKGSYPASQRLFLEFLIMKFGALAMSERPRAKLADEFISLGLYLPPESKQQIMEPPQQQHKEYQWEEADDANLKPRQSRRHRLNNHAATTDIISPSTGSGGSSNSSITDDAGSSIQSMTASRAGSATPSFKEEEEIADNNSISEEVDNEYDHTACTEFHGARENGKSTKLDNSVYFDNGQGTDPTHEVSGIRNTGHECSIFWTKLGDEELYSTVEDSNIPKGTGTEVNSHYGENFDDRTFSGSHLLPVEKSSEVQSTSVKLINNEARVEVGVDLAGKIDGQVIDLDVEAVLERQETHDLYCPNCNSCITRRIILRKRKRKVRNLRIKAKHDKYEMVLGSKSVTNPENAANQGDDTGNTFSSGSPTNADEGYTADREVDIFRCLSCFTIFIPSGDGFNLFQNFRDSHGKENMQNPRKITTSSTNWFFSLFASNKGKMATEEGNNIKSQQGGLKSLVPSAGESLMLEKSQIKIEHRSNVALGNEPLGDQKCLASSFDGASCVQSSCSIRLADDVATELWEVRKDVVDSSTPEDILLGNLSTTVEEKLDDSIEKRKADNMPPQLRRDHPTILVARRKLVYSGKHAEDASLNPQKDGDEFLVHSIPWSLTPEQSQKEIDHKSNIAQNCHASLVQGALSPCQSFRNEVHKNDATTELHETGIDTVVSSTQGGTLLQKEESNVIEKLDYAVRKNESGENVIVIVEAEPVEPAASQRAQNTAAPVGAEMLHQSGEDHEWDILKSIVYGGLIESITSLGVVSSAAGAGAAPIIVFALGVANLISGLIIIGHNLLELRNDSSGRASNQMNLEEDRYQELLGVRAKFKLHATVAFLSYLIFGSVSPVVYGVLYGEIDNREFNLAAVIATSLICIILLAIGKAHTRKSPKSYIRTVMYYITMALLASGVSYIIGNVIKEVLEKFGWFESDLVITVPF